MRFITDNILRFDRAVQCTDVTESRQRNVQLIESEIKDRASSLNESARFAYLAFDALFIAKTMHVYACDVR